MLLLPQLVKIWLPDHSATRHEIGRSLSEQQNPRSQVPPLISFLEGLSDILIPDDVKAKRFPCGHVVSLRSILACSNLFGDATWTPGPHFLGCAQPECNDTLEFPKIPDPRVVDGLEARLNLIEWSWNKDTPTELDRNTVSLLRHILYRIGHLTQEPEPEADAEVSRNEPSESSLMRTLVHMELEAFGLREQNQGKSAEVPLRGDQPYCSYRAAIEPTAGHHLLRYPIPSPGQECECVTAHEYERKASSWGLTPAETEFYPKEPKEEKRKQRKTVRFVAHEYERKASSWGLTPVETEYNPKEPKEEKRKQRKTVRFVTHEYEQKVSSWGLTPAETEFNPKEPKEEKRKQRKTVRFVTHEYEQKVSSWGLTPAETEFNPKEPKEEKRKHRKTVRFVAAAVTEVQYFEPWWCDEYRDSGRYWSTGPHKRSIDLSTPAMDDLEIERLDHLEGLAAQTSSEMEGQESACSVSDDEDDEVLDEIEKAMEKADGSLDDDILDEMERAAEAWDNETLVDDDDNDDNDDNDDWVMDEAERANELWDEESLDDLRKRHEWWEDRF